MDRRLNVLGQAWEDAQQQVKKKTKKKKNTTSAVNSELPPLPDISTYVPPTTTAIDTNLAHCSIDTLFGSTVMNNPTYLPSTELSISDPVSFILEAYDHVIAPLIQHPPTNSLAPLRRYLYRKQFTEETIKLCTLHFPINSVEQLIPIIQTACARCGLTLI